MTKLKDNFERITGSEHTHLPILCHQDLGDGIRLPFIVWTQSSDLYAYSVSSWAVDEKDYCKKILSRVKKLLTKVPMVILTGAHFITLAHEAFDIQGEKIIWQGIMSEYFSSNIDFAILSSGLRDKDNIRKGTVVLYDNDLLTHIHKPSDSLHFTFRGKNIALRVVTAEQKESSVNLQERIQKALTTKNNDGDQIGALRRTIVVGNAEGNHYFAHEPEGMDVTQFPVHAIYKGIGVTSAGDRDSILFSAPTFAYSMLCRGGDNGSEIQQISEMHVLNLQGEIISPTFLLPEEMDINHHPRVLKIAQSEKRHLATWFTPDDIVELAKHNLHVERRVASGSAESFGFFLIDSTCPSTLWRDLPELKMPDNAREMFINSLDGYVLNLRVISDLKQAGKLVMKALIAARKWEAFAFLYQQSHKRAFIAKEDATRNFNAKTSTERLQQAKNHAEDPAHSARRTLKYLNIVNEYDGKIWTITDPEVKALIIWQPFSNSFLSEAQKRLNQQTAERQAVIFGKSASVSPF